MKEIVVLQRGWVVVGDFHQEGSQCWVTDGAVVRAWGTTKGLGELAVEGPLSGTKLDPLPTTKFHELTIVARIECNAKAWGKKK